MSRKGSGELSEGSRTKSGVELCFVTDNRHKYEEASLIAKELGVELAQCPGVKLEIQSESLEEISKTSALLAYVMIKRPLMVEDAGLFVDALGGFPGPYSSYVFKTLGLRGLLKLLEGVSNRKACFKSATTIIFEPFIVSELGVVCGTISTEPRGAGGFGFDPIFIPHGERRTFAEMSIEEKNKLSHRASSMRKAIKRLLALVELKASA